MSVDVDAKRYSFFRRPKTSAQPSLEINSARRNTAKFSGPVRLFILFGAAGLSWLAIFALIKALIH